MTESLAFQQTGGVVDFPARRSSLYESPITDFLAWFRQKELELNPKFQRRAVWTPDARSYLIDTILLGFSIPKVYLRTTIDTHTQRAVRDVVDGQQRLRAIIDFADNRLVLNRRSRKFEGMRYKDIPTELQEAFLGYPISVEHLINASDSAVLEIFARLNTYTVKLSPAELRNARYDTELKWLVFWTTNDCRWFLEKYDIVSINTMVRMEDDVFFAELLNVLMNGIVDGGAAALDKLYKSNQGEIRDSERYRKTITEAIAWMDSTVGPLLSAGILGRPYQIHMLFAAYVFQKYGLPTGRLPEIAPMPLRKGIADSDTVVERLGELAEAVESEALDGPYRGFVEASSGATTRLKSRAARFLAFNYALSVR